MRLGPALQVAIAASSVLTSVAFDFGGQNDVSQTAATVAPDQDAGSLTPTSAVNGFGTIGVTVQLTPTSGESTGDQGWFQQGGGSETLGVDCSGSNAGGWTPPSGGWGGQGEGTLGVECSGSGEGGQGWGGGVGFGGGQGWGGGKGWGNGQGWGGGDSGTLGVECSGSGEGAWTPPSGGQGWGPQSSDCSQSSGFSMAGSSGGQGWGTQSSDCSQSSGFSMAGSSAVEGSQETAGSLPTGSATTESSSAGSSTTESSLTGSAPTESSAGGSATTESSATGSATSEASTPASTSSVESDSATTTESAPSTGDTEEQSSPTTASSSSTATGSSIGADANQGQTSKLRSTNTESSASSETTQQEQQQQQQQDDSSVAYTDTSGSDAIAHTSVWGSPIVAETSSNHTSAVPTFGDVTSKTGECVTGNPTEYISTEYLDWVWEHRIGPNSDTSNESNWNVMANKNWIMDKLVHNNGSMNYCVRWDTDNQLTKDVASKFQDVLTRHYNSWNKWLEGYNCWPFTEININMVGWTTKDASQFEWKDDSLGTIYEGVLDPTDGVPQCPNECYRFYDNVNNQWSDTSACKGEPYDISFWLKEDIPYGFGYDWGQEVSLNNTLQNLYDKNILFVGHEIGHGFGLPDFYDLTQKPSADFPRSIMMAYSSITITPSDGWMLRRVLDHVRSRYKF